MEWSKTSTTAPPVTKETSAATALATRPNASALPTAPTANANTSQSTVPSLPVTETAATLPAQTISVETDVLKLQIDPRGVNLVSTELLKYPLEKKPGSPNV
ncbi:MAG: hypothetical protein ACRERV_17910, partial [Methylococcales bacterium]